MSLRSTSVKNERISLFCYLGNRKLHTSSVEKNLQTFSRETRLGDIFTGMRFIFVRDATIIRKIFVIEITKIEPLLKEGI